MRTMQVDHVLILAAGKGTRMGDIGKKLPKVLWPIFEKNLLELEVAYARKIAPEAKIYINVFNYKEPIICFIKNSKSFAGITILEENEKLDSGGAIHNLARFVSYEGNVLTINADQFLFIENSMMIDALKKLESVDVLLFSKEVNSSGGYNALTLKDGLLKGIELNKILSKNKEVITFSGMSLVRLDKLNKVPGESRYFDSVADYKNQDVGTYRLESVEYWDFGTLKQYVECLRVFLEKPKAYRLYDFLIENNAINPLRLFIGGYGQNAGINFSNNEYKLDRDTIVLSQTSLRTKGSRIIWGDTSELI